jgi:hypothetical protein
MNHSGNPSFDRTLEAAVVVNWADLMRGTLTGLVHIEYGFAPSGTVDYLKVWSSITRGHWLLACEYWMSESSFHGAGIRYDNGYESQGLANILDSVMQNQNLFTLPANTGRQGLLQIQTPSHEESASAATSLRRVLERAESAVALPALV